MTRRLYGCTPADFTIAPDGALVPGATVSVHDARTGGAKVADLTDLAGAPIAEPTSDTLGLVAFFGPDGLDKTLWLDTGIGQRLAIKPVDPPRAPLRLGTVAAGPAAGAALNGDPVAGYTLDLTIPGAGIASIGTAQLADGAVTLAKLAADAHMIRVTHPNTDDKLVEVSDGTAAWHRIYYDSGSRGGLTLEGGLAATSNSRLRRVGSTVTLSMEADFTAINALGSHPILSVPTGFRPSFIYLPNAVYGANAEAVVNTYLNGAAVLTVTLGAAFREPAYVRAHWTWVTADPVPTSLPGTRVTAGA